ncbi:hypothetical protein, partial [Methylibium sp. T29]|uniref:hypothetical protein n=1 Tax=Methylibium sp. T29 TaxID=1430884 RepID=UPI0020A6C4E2
RGARGGGRQVGRQACCGQEEGRTGTQGSRAPTLTFPVPDSMQAFAHAHATHPDARLALGLVCAQLDAQLADRPAPTLAGAT